MTRQVETYPRDCRADLHSHSTASDGRLSPTQLVAAAAEAGVELLSLTDHDTVAGVAEALQAARTHALNLLPGVEISVTWERKTLHIVGLGVDPDNATLNAGLQGLQHTRASRADEMAMRLERHGASNALAGAQALAGEAQITRSHFARLLVEQGLAADFKQAFKRYLGAGKPCNVATRWAELEDAIHWIHAAGGLAVLAHPLRYKLSGAWRARMLQAFAEAGGDGLEVSSGSSQQQADISLLTRDALNFDLLASSGSDFHSPDQPWLKLGRLAPLSTRLTPIWTRLPVRH